MEINLQLIETVIPFYDLLLAYIVLLPAILFHAPSPNIADLA